MSLIELSNITKTYLMGGQENTVLHDVSLSIKEGEFVAILGQSGSGKSTLMNMIGLLDEPTTGDYHLEGKLISELSPREKTSIRGQKIGFVFQSYNLIPRLNVYRQVSLPLSYQNKSLSETKERTLQALEQVGLSDKIDSQPNQLSGGQQQRVSIARALVSNPALILADEPTGALDSHTGEEVLELFKKLNKQGKTIVMITHDQSLAAYANRQIKIVDGKVVGRTITPSQK